MPSEYRGMMQLSAPQQLECRKELHSKNQYFHKKTHKSHLILIKNMTKKKKNKIAGVVNVMVASTGSINFQLYHSKWTTLIQVLAHDLKVGQDIHQGVRRKKKDQLKCSINMICDVSFCKLVSSYIDFFPRNISSHVTKLSTWSLSQNTIIG